MTEKELHAYTRKQCKRDGIIFHKLESKSSRGFPDCMLAKAGKIIFIELKSPKKTGRVHALQSRCIAELIKEGLDARLADSTDIIDGIINEF